MRSSSASFNRKPTLRALRPILSAAEGDDSNRMSAVIQLDGIHKTYQTGDVEVHAVRGVSLKIEKGEFVAIMGASGSGKSTMMNILGCLDRPTDGHYFLDGIDVSVLSRDELAEIRNEKIGFV